MEQFERKFINWSEKLLDLTKRNSLLHYRKKRVSSLQFDEEPDGMLREILDMNFKIPRLPKSELLEMSEEQKEIVIERHNSQLKSFKTIRQNARSHYYEYGFHSCYLIFGFLHWKEFESADPFYSPLLMVPVEIEKGIGDIVFEIVLRNDEAIKLNPVIIKKLWDDFGIDLNEFAEIELNQDNSDVSIQGILKKIESYFDNPEWSVEYQIMLDNFNFQNFAIYKDLEKNKEKFFENPLIALLAGSTAEKNLGFISGFEKKVDLRKTLSKESLQIYDADSSQQEAIIKARRGDSFVLQGPPGTGKSQTITNIIAEALGLGKKVLFVSEKQAALQVVYDKLKKAGLSDFILSLHDVKQSKELIKNQLKEIATSPKDEKIVDMYLYEKLEQETSVLNDYADSLSNVLLNGFSRFELHGKLSRVLDVPSYYFDLPKTVMNLDKVKLEELVDSVDRYAHSISTNSQEFISSPWYYLRSELSFEKKARLEQMSKEIPTVYESKKVYEDNLKECLRDSNLKEYSLELVHHLMELQERQCNFNWNWLTLNANELNIELNQLKDFEEVIQKQSETIQYSVIQISNQKEVLAQKFETSFFEIQDVDAVLKKMKFKYNVFYRGIYPEYRELLAKFKDYTKDLRLDYLTLVNGLEQLNNLKTMEAELEKIHVRHAETEKSYESKKEKFFQTVNLSELDSINYNDLQSSFNWLADFQQLKVQYPHLSDSLLLRIFKEKDIQLLDLKSNLESLRKNDEYLEDIYIKLIELFPETNYERNTFFDFIQKLDFDEYQKFIDHKRIRDALINAFDLGSFFDFLDTNDIDKEDILPIFQKRLYSYLLDQNVTMERGAFSKQNHVNVISRFKDLDKQSMDLARKRVYNRLVHGLPNLDSIEYINEARVLKKEFNKKSHFLPTRKLIEKLPNLLPKYKPCIMMSPLTVSTYFGTNTEWEFDLVIFDEASQVKPEYAIGSIARGKQLVVAGDSKQMPPTSFFNASNGEDELFDDTQEDWVELESILDELAVVLPENHLNWHYRSKDEALITFSNRKFYNSRLLTFPSENIQKENTIQFTHVPNGVWESRNGNKPEADKVLESIIWYADHFPDKSLGVVAFGKSQSTQIEERLEKFLEQNPEYNSYFDENQAEPFFIKNLENVQGDERDIIIISVGYGRRPDGKLIMHFGPLTRSGGERRLNVAASRAREKMHIISSIKGNDIRIDGTTNENRQILRDFLDYAELGREVLVGYDANVVDRELHFDSDFEESVYDFLIKEGYVVHTQVGDSGYKIDLAIVHPNYPGRYLLAIECDGRAYHSSKTARDRDRLRQEILESKGWKFYRIWSSNWLCDNNNEKKTIREAIENAIYESEKSYKLLNVANYDEDNTKANSESETIKFDRVDVSRHEMDATILNGNKNDRNQESFSNETVTEDINLKNVESITSKVNQKKNHIEHSSTFEYDLEGICSILLQHAKKFRGQLVSEWIRYVNEKYFERRRLTTSNEDFFKKALLHLENTGRISISYGYLSSVEVFDYNPTSSDLQQLAELESKISAKESYFEKIASYYKLPNYQQLDVYHFKSSSKILVITELLMKISRLYIDKPVKEWFRAINIAVFGKKRLSEGYEKVYRRALKKLIDENEIVVDGDVLRLIKDKETTKGDASSQKQLTIDIVNNGANNDENTSKIMFSKVEKIVHLLKKQKVTGYRIARDTKGEAREMSLIALKEGRAEIENISFQTAQAIIKWYDLYYQDFEL